MDPWDQGDVYDRYMGRWSRPIAEQFIRWLAIRPGGAWLEVGCGTGALSTEIMRVGGVAALTSIDTSPAFVDTARLRLGDRVAFEVADGASLPYDSGRFDVAVSGLALNFIPDAAQALAEMRRVVGRVVGRMVERAGVVGVYVWDYGGGMEMIRYFWDAALWTDPAAAQFDEATRFPLCAEGPLRQLFDECGFASVRSTALDEETRFVDFDDYWTPFLGGQGPAPAYVAGLGLAQRRALVDELRRTLPIATDGSIRLRARAWAVSGTC